MSGFDFLDEVQRRAGTPIKGLVLTGNTSGEVAKLSTESGWSVLYKPIKLTSLVAAIETLDGAAGIRPLRAI
jgi:DNA-binding response OmpR family regulator